MLDFIMQLDPTASFTSNMMPFAALGGLFQMITVLFTGPQQAMLLWKAKEASTHIHTFHLCGALSATFWCCHSIFEVWTPAMTIPTFIAAVIGYTIAGQIVYYKYFYVNGYRFSGLR